MWRGGVAFAAWTIFSFLCHSAAKQFLTTEGNGFILATILTMGQLACCYVLLVHGTKGTKNSDSSVPNTANWALVMTVITHIGATFSTNYSLAVLYAPSTLTIKLMEPLMSAFVVWLVLGKPINAVTLLSMALLITGSLGFVGNPLTSLSLGAGTMLALISNILYGLRNILIKHFLHPSMSMCDNTEYFIYTLVSIASVWACGKETTLMLMLLSAVSHVVYSYISTNVILQELSVVGHAIANIAKRLLVVLLMVAAGQKQLEMHKYAWLAVCALGLSMYAYNKVKAKPQEKSVSSERRQHLTVTSLTSALLLLLLITCISLVRSPTASGGLPTNKNVVRELSAMAAANRAGVEKMGDANPIEGAIRAAPIGRKLLETKDDPGTPKWNSLSSTIVRQIGSVLPKGNVILSHFPVQDERGGSMDHVGMFYVLRELGANLHHGHGKTAQEEISAIKGADNGTFVVIGGNPGGLAFAKDYLSMPTVQGVLVFLPSALGKQKGVYSDKAFEGLPRDNRKLHLFCHDKATRDELTKKQFKLDAVTLLPSLTFCVPRVYRFLKPLYHYVFQSNEPKATGCQYIQGKSPGVRCDARSWSLKKWTTPKGKDSVEDAYLRTYIGYFYVLRGQVVIVDELAALFAAMQFDIPAVAINNAAPDMKAYRETWGDHGYGNKVRSADNVKAAAVAAQEMTKELAGELSDFEPGIKIVKNFPK